MAEIAYIVSDRRAGSTLLQNLLGQISRITAVGELRMLQGHLKREGPGESWDWRCSCREELTACPLWSKIHELMDLKSCRTRLDHSLFESHRVRECLEKYALEGRLVAEDSLKILDAIRKIAKADLVVDSSKDAMQAYYLHAQRPASVRLILLQRSIDELAYSKMKHREGRAPGPLRMWAFMNRVGRQNRSIREVVDQIETSHVYRLTYKALASDPRGEIRKLLGFLSFGPIPDQLPDSLEPQHDHSIGGTPSRFNSSPVRYDGKSASYFRKYPSLVYLTKKWQTD